MRLINSLPFIEQLSLWDLATGEWIRFALWPRQKELVEVILSKRLIIILKKRQVGASQLFGADSLIQSLAINFKTLVLSKTARDSGTFLERVRSMYLMIPTFKDLDKEHKNGIYIPQARIDLAKLKHNNPIKRGRDGGEVMTWEIGSKIASLPASQGRGDTVDRVLIDEAGFFRKKVSGVELPEVFKAVVPTVEKAKGQIGIISTANGPDMYCDMWENAELGNNGYIPFFFSCWSDPTFTQEQRDEEERNYGEDHVNQEYPRTPEEAFIATGSPRFDLKAIAEYKKQPLMPIGIGDILMVDDKQRVVKDPHGYMKFYKKRKDRCQYLVSADIAEGLEKGDFTSAYVWDLEDGDLVAEWHGHIEPSKFGEYLACIGRHYNNAVLAPERNNDGKTVIAILRHQERYPDGLIHVSHVNKKEKEQDKYVDPESRFGWVTSSKTKPMLINNIAPDLVQGNLPPMPLELLYEMRKFIRLANGTCEAESGKYDDRVMSFMIGWFLLNKYREYMLPDKPFHKCSNCVSYEQQAINCGRCERTYRWTKSDCWCRMHSWKDPKTNLAHDAREKTLSGYVPN